ncbi:MAG: DUF5686 family protein, partial [Saprospiraceae bacterium]
MKAIQLMDFKSSYFFLFFYFIGLNGLFAQQKVSGIVTDVYGEPLAFVNIIINNNATNGLTTGIDGRFSIEQEEVLEQLELSYVGYENQVRSLTGGEKMPLQIQLKLAAVGIEEITVVAGENPAHRIIRKAVENRSLHNPEKRNGYQCKTYNKMVFDWMPNQEAIEKLQTDTLGGKRRKGIFGKYDDKRFSRVDELSAQREHHYMFLMESVTERKFKKPQTINEVVLQNKVSGFKHPSFAAIANAIQPFSFYEEHLNILEKSYLNPISPNSMASYYFSIQDTLYSNADSIFIIQFEPKKGKIFDALKGLLYINTNGYAIQNVLAEPDDPAFINLKIEQQYHLIDQRFWFPEELNFEFKAEQYPDELMGIKISGKSYVSDVKINPQWNKKDFNGDSWILDNKANLATDSFWLASRPFTLSEKEKQTYVTMDSIGQEKHLDQFLKGAEALASGRWRLGKVDFLVSEVLSFNEYEDVRLGGGFSTNEFFSKWIELYAYGGYGFEDKAWKYGGGLTFNLLPNDKLQFHYKYKDDLNQDANLFSIDNNIFTNRFYAFRMSQVKEHQLALNGRNWSFLQFDVSLKKTDWQTGYDYQLVTDDFETDQFSITNLELYLRYAFGEQTVNFMGSRASTQTNFPILEFSYSKGLKILNGDYDFDRFTAAITQTFPIRRFGNIRYRIEAGLVEGAVPFNQLFTSNVVANDSWFIIIDNSFQTLVPYEFTSDRFAHLFFEYEMAAPLYRTEYSQPRVSLLQNMGFGSLLKTDVHREISIQTME